MEVIKQELGQLQQQLPQAQLQVYRIQIEIDRRERQIAGIKGELAAYLKDYEVAIDGIKFIEASMMTCKKLIEAQEKADRVSEEVEKEGDEQ